MSIDMSKEEYEKLIKDDLKFLNKHCPDTLVLDHIKLIVCSSIDWYYPEKKSFCLKNHDKVCNNCHECDVDVLNPNY